MLAAGAGAGKDRGGSSPLPPFAVRQMKADPRFTEFVILQAQNAGFFLGQIPHPATGEPAVNLSAARSVLEGLEMLEAKTRGNLTPEEERLLGSALRNLRELFERIEAEHEHD